MRLGKSSSVHITACFFVTENNVSYIIQFIIRKEHTKPKVIHPFHSICVQPVINPVKMFFPDALSMYILQYAQ